MIVACRAAVEHTRRWREHATEPTANGGALADGGGCGREARRSGYLARRRSRLKVTGGFGSTHSRPQEPDGHEEERRDRSQPTGGGGEGNAETMRTPTGGTHQGEARTPTGGGGRSGDARGINAGGVGGQGATTGGGATTAPRGGGKMTGWEGAGRMGRAKGCRTGKDAR